MAGSDLVNWQNPLTDILPAILGGESETDIDKTETSNQTGTTNTTGTSTQQTTGTQAGTTTGTSSQTTNADISALQQIFAKQSAGITPEMLTAIFTEGAKKVPGLQTAYGNAVGARASDNTPLATSIRDLQGNLTNQAAVLNNQLLKDSSITAQAIADLTKTITGQNSSSTTGSNTSNTTGTTNQTANTTQTNKTDTVQGVDTSNTVNTDVLKVLAGLGIGGSALDTILGGNGVTGGLNSLIGKITGVIPGAVNSLLSGGAPSIDLTGSWDGLFGEGSIAKDLEQFGINWNGDLGVDQALNGFNFDTSNFDWSGDLGDYLTFGWADGGSIDAQGSTGTLQVAPELRKQVLEKMTVLQQVLNDPKGRQLLAAKASAAKQKYGSFGADDWRKDTKKYAKANKLEMPQYNFLDAALGLTADNPDPFQQSMEQTNKITAGYLSSLPPGAQRQYMKVMQKDLAGNKFNQFMDKVMPMIPGAVAGIGLGGALGILNPGMAGAAGFGTAGAGSGLGSAGNMLMRQLLSKAISTGTSKLAEGGRVHRPGDPVIGTKGPEKKGSGTGGLSDEAVAAAMRKSQSTERPAEQPARRGNGLSFQTNKMLKEIDNYAEGGEVEGTVLEEMDDPEGIEDTISAQLSVGEYVIPADVVESLGVDFFDHLKEKYHTPVEMQKAMGIGGVSS